MTLRDYDDARQERHSSPMRWLLGLSGSVAAGMIVLTIVVAGAAYLGEGQGFPGPGQTSIVVHVFASVIALIVQVWADRRSGAGSVFGAFVVFAIAAGLFWTQWWG
ncbi:hypothetical protein [Rhodococcus sp. NPDC058521]|uniref:hypothetical protein n=1 Tax=Rhodococcus sp. NPDC058521 TaxID=3346536 RepID=UPI00365AFBEC